MTQKNNPWETDLPDANGEAATRIQLKPIKIAKLSGAKNDFNLPLKVIIAVLLLLWLASGFYQVQPSGFTVWKICRYHRFGVALSFAVPD